MSYNTAQRQELSKNPIFSWWYVDNVDDNDKKGEYSSYLRNVRIKGATLTVRPWYYQYLLLSMTPISIDTYKDNIVVRTNHDTDKKLIVIDENRDITEITTTWITSDAHMNFTNAWGYLYCMNGVDNLTKLTGTTHTEVTTWLANFKPKFSVVFNSSHFASWRSENPTVVYKSVWDDFDMFSWTWSDIYTFPEPITWLAVSQQSLFYFTKNTITATSRSDVQETNGQFSYITTPITTKEWATNHRCIVQAGNDLYYLTPNNKIMKVIRGANIEWFENLDVSHRKYAWIDKLMWSLNNTQDNAFWYYDNINNRCIRHLQEYGETIPTIILIYDRTLDVFLIDNNKYYTDTTIYRDAIIATSRYENKLRQDEVWNTDDGQAIQADYRTKILSITNETTKKILRETRTAYNISSPWEFTQEIWIDWKLYDIKTITQGISSDWWIGTEPVWESPIWENEREDISKVSWYITRTKGQLWKRFFTMQIVRKTTELGTVFDIKTFQCKVEILSPIITNR